MADIFCENIHEHMARLLIWYGSINNLEVKLLFNKS